MPFLEGLLVGADGALQVDATTPVGSIYLHGTRVSEAGRTYVNTGGSPAVYIDGIAHDSNGAALIAPSGTADYVDGVPVTADGRIVYTQTLPTGGYVAGVRIGSAGLFLEGVTGGFAMHEWPATVFVDGQQIYLQTTNTAYEPTGGRINWGNELTIARHFRAGEVSGMSRRRYFASAQDNGNNARILEELMLNGAMRFTVRFGSSTRTNIFETTEEFFDDGTDRTIVFSYDGVAEVAEYSINGAAPGVWKSTEAYMPGNAIPPDWGQFSSGEYTCYGSAGSDDDPYGLGVRNSETAQFLFHDKFIALNVPLNREKFYKNGRSVDYGTDGNFIWGEDVLIHIKNTPAELDTPTLGGTLTSWAKFGVDFTEGDGYTFEPGQVNPAAPGNIISNTARFAIPSVTRDPVNIWMDELFDTTGPVAGRYWPLTPAIETYFKAQIRDIVDNLFPDATRIELNIEGPNDPGRLDGADHFSFVANYADAVAGRAQLIEWANEEAGTEADFILYDPPYRNSVDANWAANEGTAAATLNPLVDAVNCNSYYRPFPGWFPFSAAGFAAWRSTVDTKLLAASTYYPGKDVWAMTSEKIPEAPVPLTGYQLEQLRDYIFGEGAKVAYWRGFSSVLGDLSPGNIEVLQGVPITASAPTITLDPVTQAVTAGDTLSLTVAGTDVLVWWWFKDGVSLPYTTDPGYDPRITGYFSNNLQISNFSAGDEGSYTAVGYGDQGPVTSAAAVITVNTNTVAVEYIPMHFHFEDTFDVADVNHSSHRRDTWESEPQTGSISKPSDILTITSPTTITAAKYQSRESFEYNFFVSPIKVSINGWAHTGGAVSTRRFRWGLVPQRADKYAGVFNPDFFANSAVSFYVKENSGGYRLYLGFKNNVTDQNPNIVAAGNVVALDDYRVTTYTITDYELNLNAYSYELLLFSSSGLEERFAGAHGLDVANWGRRGDAVCYIENNRDNTIGVDPATNTLTITDYSVEALLYHECWSNETVEAADVANTGLYSLIGNSTADPTYSNNEVTFNIDDTGANAFAGYVTPVSKMYNFFTQSIQVQHYFDSPTAGTRAAWALMDEGVSPRLAEHALACTLDSANNLRLSVKIASDGTGWPEDVGTVLLTYNGTGNIIGFRLDINRDFWAYNVVALIDDGSEESAGIGSLGGVLNSTNDLPWNWGPLTWNSAGDLCNNGDSCVFIGGYRAAAGSAVTVSAGVSSIRRMQYWWEQDKNFGPVGDGISPEFPLYALQNWSDQTRKQYGIVDPAFGPFNADSTGAEVCTEQWRQAAQFCRYWSKPLVPSPGTYLIDDMIQEIAPLRRRTSNIESPNLEWDTSNWDSPSHLIGGKNAFGGGVIVRLEEGAKGFQNPANRKQMFFYWARNLNDPLGAGQTWRLNKPNTLMSQNVSHMRFETGVNPGAVCHNLKAAQECSLRHVVFDATGGLYGSDGGPGSGGDCIDIECIGGVTGLFWQDQLDYMGGTQWRLNDEGAQAGPTIHGFKFSGQTGNVIEWSGRGTLTIESPEGVVSNGNRFIQAKTESFVESIAKNMFYIRDYNISYASFSGSNIPFGGNRSTKAMRGWVENAASLMAYTSLPAGNAPIATTLGVGTYRIDRYEQGIDGLPYAGGNLALPSQFRSRRYVGGVAATLNSGFAPVLDAVIPADLYDKNIPVDPPHIDDADVTWITLTEDQRLGRANANGVFATAKAAGSKIGVPAAFIDDRLIWDLDADTQIVAAGRNIAFKLPRGETDDYAGPTINPLFSVPDTGSGDAWVVDLGCHAPVENRYVHIGLVEGMVNLVLPGSILRNSFGYGGSQVPNPANTGKEEYRFVGANAEGKIFGIVNGEDWRQTQDSALVALLNTVKRLEFKDFNGEHWKSDGSFRAFTSDNWVVSGSKTEGNHAILLAVNCDNFAYVSISGNAQAFPVAHTPNEDSDAAYGDQLRTILYETGVGNAGLAPPVGASPNYNYYPSTAQPVPGGEANLVSSLIKTQGCTNYEIGMTQGQHQGDGGGTLGAVFGLYYACHRWSMINHDGTLTKAGYPSDTEADRPVTYIQGAPTVLTEQAPPVPPSISLLSPNSGDEAGGTPVTATGDDFTGTTGVTVGGNPATGVTVNTDEEVEFTTPAGTAGAQNVIVTTPAGASAPATFTYTAASARYSVADALTDWIGGGTWGTFNPPVVPSLTAFTPTPVTPAAPGAFATGSNAHYVLGAGDYTSGPTGSRVTITGSNKIIELADGARLGAVVIGNGTTNVWILAQNPRQASVSSTERPFGSATNSDILIDGLNIDDRIALANAPVANSNEMVLSGIRLAYIGCDINQAAFYALFTTMNTIGEDVLIGNCRVEKRPSPPGTHPFRSMGNNRLFVVDSWFKGNNGQFRIHNSPGRPGLLSYVLRCDLDCPTGYQLRGDADGTGQSLPRMGRVRYEDVTLRRAGTILGDDGNMGIPVQDQPSQLEMINCATIGNQVQSHIANGAPAPTGSTVWTMSGWSENLTYTALDMSTFTWL